MDSNQKINTDIADIDLKSFTPEELEKWFVVQGYESFRGQQVLNWIYKNGVEKFNDMHNLPQNLINFLEENCFLTNLKLENKAVARDGTIKYLWKLKDEEYIESVYLPVYHKKRHTVCISSQVGCARNCQFCATGQKGLVRNLSAGEIVDQVLKIQNDISHSESGTPALTNIVYMGMGEPFDNTDHVLKSIFILNDEQGLNIGMRKITISTAGVAPEIREFAHRQLQTGLAISLNAPTDKLRNKIMPINKKYPLSELMSAVRDYLEITGRRVTFEYILMAGINDSTKQALQLVELIKNINCHLNLIPANPVPDLNIKRPKMSRVNKFKNIIDDNNISVTVRKERGTNIEAACGQLRAEKTGGI